MASLIAKFSKMQKSFVDWRVNLEMQYAVICKFCSRKVIDPAKNNIHQIFTKNKCPHCFLSKNQPNDKQSTKI